MEAIVTQKHLFNAEGDKTTEYKKIIMTKEVKVRRLFTWLEKQEGIYNKREFNYGELQESDKWINSDFSDWIVLANWNHTPDKLMNYIEDLGIHAHWIDEFTSCSECGNFMQTSPDCYSWTPNYITTDYGYVCRDCIENDITIITDNEYQNSPFIDNDDKVLPVWTIELIEKEGFVCYEGNFESGLHSYQTDTAEKILKAIKEIDINKFDRLWVIDGTGQFDIDFSLYLRPKTE